MLPTVDILGESGLSDESLDFLERSKLYPYSVVEFGQRVGRVMGSPAIMGQLVGHRPEWGTTHKLPLAPAATLPYAEVLDALNKRRASQRRYDPAGLTFAELSQLLRLTYAITDTQVPAGRPPARNIASGGGLYPIELFYVSRHTQGLPDGVYYYNLQESALELLREFATPAERDAQLRTAFMADGKDMDHAAASGYVVFGGILNRVSFKYQDRGLRFALLDAGALLHSLGLATGALQLASCSMGGYLDNQVNELIGFKGTLQTVLHVAMVGKAPR
jgi:SagB-type dehydrogenase family enzyme